MSEVSATSSIDETRQAFLGTLRVLLSDPGVRDREKVTAVLETMQAIKGLADLCSPQLKLRWVLAQE